MRGKKVLAFIISLTLLLASDVPANAHWPVVDSHSWVSQWYKYGHEAVDIVAYCGAKILPVRSGKVIFAGWKNNGGGWQVWTRTSVDGKDIYTIYAHMIRRPPVVSGQYVRYQATRIGNIGSTGHSTGCHVHLMMWRGYPWASGSYEINPWRQINHGTYLPRRYR